MFAKGYTNIRAMIETQYGILSHMITDIAYRYQTLLKLTAIVFASYCISIYFLLNGRKVIT